MNLPLADRAAACDACPCHIGAQHRGLPTRRHGSGPLKSVAVLLIGNRPGVEEDEQGEVFVGASGTICTTAYIGWRNLSDKADVYLTNAVRCMPPVGVDPRPADASCCALRYLDEDITALKDAYPRVVVLACGALADQVMLDCNQSEALQRQGDIGWHGLPVFSTYNPAELLPTGDPAKAHSVNEHLRLLHDFIDTGTLPVKLLPVLPRRAVLPDLEQGAVVAFDIETDNILEGGRQTAFHPMKCLWYDGLPLEQYLVTLSLAWGDDQSAVYVLPDDRFMAADALRRCVEAGAVMVGHNVAYDVVGLRTYSGFKKFFDWGFFDEHGARLADTSALLFAESSVRPERGLKAAARLLGITDYRDQLTPSGSRKKYRNRFDEALWTYNALDARTTLAIYNRAIKVLGSDPAFAEKVSDYARRFWSDLLWSIVEMTEAGIAMSRARLTALGEQYTTRMRRIEAVVRGRYNGIVRGDGSMKWWVPRFRDIAERAGLLSDPRLLWTKGKRPTKASPYRQREIGTSEGNVKLAVANLPATDPDSKLCRHLLSFKKCDKMNGTFVSGLLNGSKKHPCDRLAGGVAYPTYFVCPSRITDGEGDEGGTVQSRLAAQGPPVHNFPSAIKACCVSRFDGGSLLEADYANQESCVAALISGDPVFMQEFYDGIDRHAATAIMLFGPDIVKHPRFRSFYRQIGKICNFGGIYGAISKTLQANARKRGLEVDIRLFDEFRAGNRRKYPRLHEWQREEVALSTRRGYSIIGPLADTRMYGASERVNREAYITVILNIVIQSPSARITQSGQVAMQKWIRSQGMRTRLVTQTHDSTKWDAPPDEKAEVRSALSRLLSCPEYYSILCERLGRSVPLTVEIKESS